MKNNKNLAFETFLVFIEKERGYSLNTIDAYRRDIGKFNSFLIKYFDTSSIDYKMVDKWALRNFFGKEILKKQDINNRLFNKDLGGGVILDLGCYPTSFCILVASLHFDLDINKIKVKTNSKQFGTTGVEIDSSASINFNNMINAEVETSFIRNIGSQSEIIGDKGKLLIRDTWQGSPSINLILDNKNKEIFNDAKNNCYYYQIKNISNSILNKKSKPDQPIMDFEKSYINMNILEKWKNNEK